MEIPPERIVALIEYYGKENSYPSKSYLPRFCDDFGLNYTQWNNYTRDSSTVKAGGKIVDKLLEIFPLLNLNWLLKGEGYMFSSGNAVVIEPATAYGTNKETDIFKKLEMIHEDIKSLKESYRLSQN